VVLVLIKQFKIKYFKPQNYKKIQGQPSSGGCRIFFMGGLTLYLPIFEGAKVLLF